MPTCHALVPCAGTGVRAGQGVPKQYVRVAGRAVAEHTLRALAEVERISTLLVVLGPDDDRFERDVHVPAGRTVVVVRCGGATRAESVARGLDALAARGAAVDDWVLVHDAARCLVRAAWVDRLIDACLEDAVGGLLAMPLADTLKQSTPEGRVAATRDRTGLWRAQTPQMFRLGALRIALSQAGPGVTDEASAIEATGRAPLLVPGDLENFKLTQPGDFALAERLLAARA
jgi:2-C-methyl-D-erythritol 4-phosphate cytidylyltransferase